MESYKLKQNFYGIMQAYLSPILTLAVIIYFFVVANARGLSTLMWVYFTILIAFVGYRYFMYIKRPMEIEVSGDQIKMKDILGKVTELTFNDIEDIEVNKRKELFFNLKERKIRGLNTFKDFDKFLDDAKTKNPAIKFWGFNGR